MARLRAIVVESEGAQRALQDAVHADGGLALAVYSSGQAKPSQARRCDQLAGRACQDIWRGIGNSDSRVAAHGSVAGECPRSVGRVGVVASLGSQDRRGPTMRCLRILPTFDPVSDRSPFVLRAIEKAAGIVALRPPGSFNWVVLKCCLVRLPRQAQN
jgi:hypothetical protein